MLGRWQGISILGDLEDEVLCRGEWLMSMVGLWLLEIMTNWPL